MTLKILNRNRYKYKHELVYYRSYNGINIERSKNKNKWVREEGKDYTMYTGLGKHIPQKYTLPE